MAQAYQPLHHKYRPQRFDQLVGQEAIAATLSQALLTGRIAPAYLFSGPRGTGKTSSARILARSLNCTASAGPTPEPCGRCELCEGIAAGNALDVIEIDAASNTGVDNIRDLIERSRFAPVQARWKVYVVDECHMLSTAAFNALLKTLDEPPPQFFFVLATTDPQRVLPTILSRCQRFDFRRIPLEALQRHLAWIAEQEAIGITPEALHVVAQRAQGGLRDAESLLDQLSLLPPPIEPVAVWELLGAVPEEELLELAAAMAEAEPLPLVEAVRLLLDRGREPSAVLQGLAGMLRDLLLAGVAPERLELTSVSPSLRTRLNPLARRIGKARLLHWQAQLKGSEQQLRLSVQPRLWLEVLLLGLLSEPAVAAGPPQASQSAAVAQRSEPAPAPPPVAVPAPPSTPSVPVPVTSAAAAPAVASAVPVPAAAVDAPLPELWQQILAGLELPSTRMLLSQQAQLVRLDGQRAVVRVAGMWMAMVQSRASLLEAALQRALGASRQLVLESGDPVAPSPGSPASRSPEPIPVRPRVVASAVPLAAAPDSAAEEAVSTASALEASPVVSATPSSPGGGHEARGGSRSVPEPAPAPPSPPSSAPAPSAVEPAAAADAPVTAPKGSGSAVEDKARQLAAFFNGELVELPEDPAGPDSSGQGGARPDVAADAIGARGAA
ncbi:MAG: DNA polymerase III subunit gamma/tau [Cyanobium sp.]